MVFASQHFDPDDGIRNYSEFSKNVGTDETDT